MILIRANFEKFNVEKRNLVELFLIFVNLSVVTFFHHSFLCKVYQILTCEI